MFKILSASTLSASCDQVMGDTKSVRLNLALFFLSLCAQLRISVTPRKVQYLLTFL